MKRSIGTKVLSVLIILGVIFGLGIVANVAALQTIDGYNKQLVNVYLKMENMEGELDFRRYSCMRIWYIQSAERISRKR